MTIHMTDTDIRFCPIRITLEANQLLRFGPLRRGDISRRLIAAIEQGNWQQANPPSRRKAGGSPGNEVEYTVLAVNLPVKLHARLKQFCENKGHSIAEMVEALIIQCYQKGGLLRAA